MVISSNIVFYKCVEILEDAKNKAFAKLSTSTGEAKVVASKELSLAMKNLGEAKDFAHKAKNAALIAYSNAKKQASGALKDLSDLRKAKESPRALKVLIIGCFYFYVDSCSSR